MTWVVVILAVLAAGGVAARPLLSRFRSEAPERARDATYKAFREVVPLPGPSVRNVSKRIVAACRRQRVKLPFGGRPLLPDSFEVWISAEEYDAVEDYLDIVSEAVASTLAKQAREKEWTVNGQPVVQIERDETVAAGRPRIKARATRPAPPVQSGPPIQPPGFHQPPAGLRPEQPRQAPMPPPAMPPPAPPAHRPEPTRQFAEPTRESGQPEQPARPATSGLDPDTISVEPTVQDPILASQPIVDDALSDEPTEQLTAPPLAEPIRRVLDAAVPYPATAVPAGQLNGAPRTDTAVFDGVVGQVRDRIPQPTPFEPNLRSAEPTRTNEPVGARHRFVAIGPGAERGREKFTVDRALTIGRSEACDIIVDYASASRQHLRLEISAAGCLVTDLTSTHGTYVDGRQVTMPTVLRAGQSVRIGKAGPTWVYRPG